MCGSSPKAPNAPPPPAPPPPPPAEATQMAPASEATRSESDIAKSRKKGRNALKIDLQTGTGGGTGLNVAAG